MKRHARASKPARGKAVLHTSPAEDKTHALEKSVVSGVVLDGEAVGYAISLNERGALRHDVTIRLSTRNASIYSRLHLGGPLFVVLTGRKQRGKISTRV